MPTLVDEKLTKTPLPRLAQALSKGHERVMGQLFTAAVCMACGFAQLCIESGNGEKAHNYNYHNEKLGFDWDGLYCQFKCDEIFDPRMARLAQQVGPGLAFASPWKGGPNQRVVLIPPHPWSNFVAFDGDEELPKEEQMLQGEMRGTARYLEFLSCRERYKKAWHALCAGEPVEFSHELRAAGYYTADRDTYTAGLLSIFHRSLPLCEATLAGERSLFSDDDISFIQGQVAANLQQTIWTPDRHFEFAA